MPPQQALCYLRACLAPQPVHEIAGTAGRITSHLAAGIVMTRPAPLVHSLDHTRSTS